MRMQSPMAWPLALFEPTSQSKPGRKTKVAEPSLALSEFAVQRVPGRKHDVDEGDDHPGEKLDIIV